jgi:Calcineurin-like phosphoesterase
MRRSLTAMAVLAACLAATSTAVAHDDQPTTYAIFGDTPYGADQFANFANDVAQINADRKVSLVVHLGDIKNGSTTCPTSYFDAIRADFDAFQDPLVYTPGDNEWTDCHRANNGGYQPAGAQVVDPASIALLGPDAKGQPSRLDEVRRIFFPTPGLTLGKHPRPVDHQAAPYVENVSWLAARTQFGVIDIPGSNNDSAPWFGAAETQELKDIQAAEVAGRTQAALDWLDHIFRAAVVHRAHGVAIGIQADMWDPAIKGDPASYSAFTSFVQHLAKLARQFHRPVLLLDGDSHIFTDDHPLADPAHPENNSIYGVPYSVRNLRRITVNGSTTPCHEYLRLRFSSDDDHGWISYERVQFANQPGIVYPPGAPTCPHPY